MNIANLFEIQRKLDAEIEAKHPTLPGENRLAKRILALQVELGECANEWRGFKFWSNDQEPRTAVMTTVAGRDNMPNYVEKNPLLEEYVDCLHFVLSIGLDMDLEDVFIYGFISVGEDIDDLFSSLMSIVFHLKKYSHPQKMEDLYSTVFSEFIGLGEMLGFTWEQIEEAYMSKNAINHQRQAEGY